MYLLSGIDSRNLRLLAGIDSDENFIPITSINLRYRGIPFIRDNKSSYLPAKYNTKQKAPFPSCSRIVFSAFIALLPFASLQIPNTFEELPPLSGKLETRENARKGLLSSSAQAVAWHRNNRKKPSLHSVTIVHDCQIYDTFSDLCWLCFYRLFFSPLPTSSWSAVRFPVILPQISGTGGCTERAQDSHGLLRRMPESDE